MTAVMAAGCAGPPPDEDAGDDAGLPLACPPFDAPVALGTVQDDALLELSGLVASRSLPGVLWTHNDAGDEPRIFALSLTGEVLARHAVRGAEAVDWEDIAIGPGPDDTPHLYIADLGDNDGIREQVVVVRVPEPPAADGRDLVATPIVLRYPGSRRDAEALLVDPASGDLVVVTKDPSGYAEVFVAPAPHVGPQVLQPVGEIDAGAPVTAADVDAAGTHAMLRTTEGAMWIPLAPGLSLAEALLGPGCPLTLDHEQQGEAVAYDPLARGWLTIEEAASPTLWLVSER
jgi:hypothetical protein